MFDFPLTIKAETEIPEQFRGLYEPAEGGFALIEPLRKKVDNSKLISALQSERQAKATLESELTQYRAFGAVDEVKTLVAQGKLYKPGKSGDEIEAVKQQLVQQHEAEKAALQQAIEQKDKQLRSVLVESTAVSAISAAKGLPQLLLPAIQSQVVVKEENGKPVTRVLNAQGAERLKADGSFFGVEDLVNELKADPIYARCFDGAGQSGSGAPPASGAGAGVQTYTLQEWTAKLSEASDADRTKLVKDKVAGRIDVRTE
jgi:hypothetical protein